MEENSTKTQAGGTALFAGEAWFDPIEAGIRDRVRGFIEELLEQELTAALGRTRHERAEGEPPGYRNGARTRQLLGSFGPVEFSVPRARMTAEGGGTQEWRSATLPRYARMTRQVEALIAGAYLSGTNTRRVKRALAALCPPQPFHTLSRVEPWAAPPDVPAQRCTVRKHRNLLPSAGFPSAVADGTFASFAHAPDALHEEISADYTDMIYAETAKEVQARCKAFLRKWRLRCPAVATSLEEAGDHLFAFLRLPPSQWKSARTTNAIERLHEEFKRRIKTQTVLPSAETAAMLFWALLASGQITMPKVNGWQTLGEKLTAPVPVDLAA